MRLLLDEHFSPAIARHLRDRGFDVVAVVERPDLTGATDGALLETMGGEGRVIVTENVGDFVPLAARVLADGGGHAGILLTSSSRFPRTTDGIGAIMRALAAVMASDPAQDAGRDEVRWLVRGDGPRRHVRRARRVDSVDSVDSIVPSMLAPGPVVGTDSLRRFASCRRDAHRGHHRRQPPLGDA